MNDKQIVSITEVEWKKIKESLIFKNNSNNNIHVKKPKNKFNSVSINSSKTLNVAEKKIKIQKKNET